MKNQYVSSGRHWLLAGWLLATALNSRAQPTQPPGIGWQRVIESGDVTPATIVKAAAAGNGGYGILAGKNLIRLSAAGDVLWNQRVPGTYPTTSTGTNATNRAAVVQTLALAAAPDGGFAVLARDTLKAYYVAKFNGSGTLLWTRTVGSADTGPNAKLTADALVASPNGGYLIVGSFSNGSAYLTLTKLAGEGYITGEWRVRFTDAGQSRMPTIRRGLSLSDGGYLLVGSAGGSTTVDAGSGLALKLDKQSAITWQRTYPTVSALTDVVTNPATDGTFAVIGLGPNGSEPILNVAPNGNGTVVATLTNGSAMPSLAGDGSGNLTVLDATGAGNPNFRLTNLTTQAVVRYTKTYGGSGADVPTMLLPTDDGGYLAVGTTTSTDGDVAGRAGTGVATWVVKFGAAVPANALTLLAPTYNCQSGAIVFNTSGGDGTPITYAAAGVTRANATDNFGVVESGLRSDPKPIVITATQSGRTVRYAFDFGAYCQTNPNAQANMPTPLRLLPPTYNCQSGAFIFNVGGGDGSLVEFAAAGITSWATNPRQFVDVQSRTVADVKPFTLFARQNGQVVTYQWDLKAACGRARIGASDVAAAFTVTILGNPAGEMVTVEITGAEAQPLHLHLMDGRGRLVEQRDVATAAATERQTFELRGQPAGTLLLHTTAPGQMRTVKVIKR